MQDDRFAISHTYQSNVRDGESENTRSRPTCVCCPWASISLVELIFAADDGVRLRKGEEMGRFI